MVHGHRSSGSVVNDVEIQSKDLIFFLIFKF